MSIPASLVLFVDSVLPWWNVCYTILVVLSAALMGGYAFRDRLYPIRREFAPWWDKFDTLFAVAIGVILLGGYATFVESISCIGLWNAFGRFIERSGLLALLTAFTAIIALYRLRHRPNKIRPTVREDFEDHDGDGTTDFGLRNYGPGPALYLQAAVEVVDDDSDDDDNSEFDPVTCFEVHEHPIHLQEGEFASLVLERDDCWVEEAIEEFGIQDLEECDNGEPRDSVKINLHYTYVSQSGAREPTDVTAERDDADLLKCAELTNRDGDLRRIELWRVANAVSSGEN